MCDVKCQRVFPGSRWWQFAYLTSAQCIWTHLCILKHTHVSTGTQTPTFTIKTEQKKSYNTFSVPYSHLKIAGTACHLNANTPTHTHIYQRQKPASIDHDISAVSHRWYRNCRWQIDWKVLPLFLIHHSGLFIIVLLLNPSAGKRRESHLGQPWPPEQLYATYPKQDSHDFFSFNSTLPSSWRWKWLNVISLLKFELLDNLMPKVLYLWEVGKSLKFNLKSWRDLSELFWNVWKFGFFLKIFSPCQCVLKNHDKNGERGCSSKKVEYNVYVYVRRSSNLFRFYITLISCNVAIMSNCTDQHWQTFGDDRNETPTQQLCRQTYAKWLSSYKQV